MKPKKKSKRYSLPTPTREEFKTYFLGVLKDFNYFESQMGTYRQVKGVLMGSTIAPLIANIFIGCLERSVVKKLIDKGLIISWTRFADDCIAIIKKNSHDEILTALKIRDQDLQFTSEFHRSFK